MSMNPTSIPGLPSENDPTSVLGLPSENEQTSVRGLHSENDATPYVDGQPGDFTEDNIGQLELQFSQLDLLKPSNSQLIPSFQTGVKIPTISNESVCSSNKMQHEVKNFEEAVPGNDVNVINTLITESDEISTNQATGSKADKISVTLEKNYDEISTNQAVTESKDHMNSVTLMTKSDEISTNQAEGSKGDMNSFTLMTKSNKISTNKAVGSKSDKNYVTLETKSDKISVTLEKNYDEISTNQHATDSKGDMNSVTLMTKSDEISTNQAEGSKSDKNYVTLETKSDEISPNQPATESKGDMNSVTLMTKSDEISPNQPATESKGDMNSVTLMTKSDEISPNQPATESKGDMNSVTLMTKSDEISPNQPATESKGDMNSVTLMTNFYEISPNQAVTRSKGDINSVTLMTKSDEISRNQAVTESKGNNNSVTRLTKSDEISTNQAVGIKSDKNYVTLETKSDEISPNQPATESKGDINSVTLMTKSDEISTNQAATESRDDMNSVTLMTKSDEISTKQAVTETKGEMNSVTLMTKSDEISTIQAARSKWENSQVTLMTNFYEISPNQAVTRSKGYMNPVTLMTKSDDISTNQAVTESKGNNNSVTLMTKSDEISTNQADCHVYDRKTPTQKRKTMAQATSFTAAKSSKIPVREMKDVRGSPKVSVTTDSKVGKQTAEVKKKPVEFHTNPAGKGGKNQAKPEEQKKTAIEEKQKVQSKVFRVYVAKRLKASDVNVHYIPSKVDEKLTCKARMQPIQEHPGLWEVKINIPINIDYIYYYAYKDSSGRLIEETLAHPIVFDFEVADMFQSTTTEDMILGCWAYIKFYNEKVTRENIKNSLIALTEILKTFKKLNSTFIDEMVIPEAVELMRSNSQKQFLMFILVKCVPINSLEKHELFSDIEAKSCCQAYSTADLSLFPAKSNAVLEKVALLLCETAFNSQNPFTIVLYFYKCLTLEDCISSFSQSNESQTDKQIDDCFQFLIPEMKIGEEKAKSVLLLLLQQIKEFEHILSLSDKIESETDIPASVREKVKSQAVLTAISKANLAITRCSVKSRTSLTRLKVIIDKVTDKEMQSKLRHAAETKVLDIIKAKHCEWESLQSIVGGSFLFPGGQVSKVLKEFLKTDQNSTQNVFVDILKCIQNQYITQDVVELCIDWLKKAIDKSRDNYVRREERIREMYRSVGMLLEINSISENSELVGKLEMTVKVEVEKIDIQTFMCAASEVEKLMDKGKDLYNNHAHKKAVKYEEKLKDGKLNSHLERVLGQVAETSLVLDQNAPFSFLDGMLKKVDFYGVIDHMAAANDLAIVLSILANIDFWYKVTTATGSYSTEIKKHQTLQNILGIMRQVYQNIDNKNTSIHFSKKLLQVYKKFDKEEKEKLCTMIKLLKVFNLDQVMQQLADVVSDVDSKIQIISDMFAWLIQYEGVDCTKGNTRLHIEGLKYQHEQFKELSRTVSNSLEHKLSDIVQATGLVTKWYFNEACVIQKVINLHSFHKFLLKAFFTGKVFSEEIPEFNSDTVLVCHSNADVTDGEAELVPESPLMVEDEVSEGDLPRMEVNEPESLEVKYRIIESRETASMVSTKSVSLLTLVQIICNSIVPEFKASVVDNICSDSEELVVDIQYLFLRCSIQAEMRDLSTLLSEPLPKSAVQLVKYVQMHDEVVGKASELVRLAKVFSLNTEEDMSGMATITKVVINQNYKKNVMTASMLWKSMESFEKLTAEIDEELWEIIHELSKCSSLVEFLHSVINEDLRNLIDAVEEHSEQFVQESTVSDLIDVTSILKPLLNKPKFDSMETLLQEIITCLSSRKKCVAQKINNCSVNCNGLKTLYMNVANRGEVTKETVMKILEEGDVSFTIENDIVSTLIHYKNRDGQIIYGLPDLGDLRSRVLLIANTEGTEDGMTGDKKGYLAYFVEMCDLTVEISLLLENLHLLGHFGFQNYKYEITQSDNKNPVEELRVLSNYLQQNQESWQTELKSVQDKFYYMNYIHSKQIFVLREYFAFERNKCSAVSILKYIKPSLEVNTLKDNTGHTHELSLEQLADAIHAALADIADIYTHFPEDEYLWKQIQNIDANVRPGEVYVAHLDPQCEETIPVFLSLYSNTTKLFPLPSQLLFCDEQTTGEDIQLLINRCIFRPMKYKNNLYCIVGVEKLPSEIQYQLVQSIKNLKQINGKNLRTDFLLCVLCRAVSHNSFLTSLKDFVHQAPSISSHAMKACLQNACKNVNMITSDLPGQGKSENVHVSASKLSFGVTTVPISGPISKDKLVQLVISMKLRRSSILHLDIGLVDQPYLLNNFIFEFLVLRCATSGTKCAHLSNQYVAIEVSNTLNHSLWNSLSVCSSFQRTHLKWEHFSNFLVSTEPKSAVQTVCQYLLAQEIDTVGNKDIKVCGDINPLSTAECRRLLSHYFGDDTDLSFSVVNVFLQVLADQLRKLSASQYFKTACLTLMLGDERSMKTVRNEIVRTLIAVSKEFSCRSMGACRDMVNSTVTTETDVMLSQVEGMIQWSDSNHLLVLFQGQDNQTVSSVYRDLSAVPDDVKKLLETQTSEKLPDLAELSQADLLHMLEKLVCLSKDTEVQNRLGHLYETYALTPDNILKMVLVILRIRTGIPVILMGETGCGKTTLIKYLALTCGVNLEVFAFHAGITEEMFIRRIHEWNAKARRDKESEYWLFLDEINTCDHLGMLKEIICHKSCGGKQLASNLATLAACNPYRLREKHEILTAGLEGKSQSDEFSRLVYRVHPLPEAMIDYIWDYGTLHRKDEISYIHRMVQSVTTVENNKSRIVKILVYSQQFIREKEQNASAVSLRDVHRCRTLISWFVDFLEKKNKFQRKGEQVNLVKDYTEIAVLLALSQCYVVRLTNTVQRKVYWEGVANIWYGNKKLYSTLIKYVHDEQIDILNRMIIPNGIAKNTSLRENVFVLFVCILNRIPVFLVGKPGCSKSLSVQLLKSNLRGKDSDDDFFKALPQLYIVSYQGSESSTSDGIIKVFDKAEKYNNHNMAEHVLPVVLLDEVGLAEISPFNPLKVLHSLLEPSTGEYPEVAVVGISNWALDAAKMNRAIHLSRPDLTDTELFATAKAIQDGLDTKSLVPEYVLRCLAEAYFEYQNSQPLKNFHGLRDYYSLIKYMCVNYPSSQTEVHYRTICEKLQMGIQRNFGGHGGNKDAFTSAFQKFFKQRLDLQNNIIGPECLIKDNLNDRRARHLMIITHGDYSLGIIANLLKDSNRNYEIIFGSQFENDLSEEYNYCILSKIILCMEQCIVLILKDLEGIYGSLYDMLNQNYTVVGRKKNCRIALGAHSNPMCVVHDEFRCIVMVDTNKVDYSDPPFLNRFEKQVLSFDDILKDTQIKCIGELNAWVRRVSRIPDKPFQAEDAFLGYHKQTVPSLLHHLQKERLDMTEEQLIKCCKSLLLKTCPADAIMRLSVTEMAQQEDVEYIQDQYFYETLIESFTAYVKNEFIVPKKSVILTRSNINFNIEQILSNVIQVQVERLSSFKSEKQLNQSIASFFKGEDSLLVIQCTPSLDSNNMLLMKLLLDKHRENYYVNKTENLALKCVAIVIHLNWQDDHGQSGWQFDYTNNWEIVTIDRLDDIDFPITASLLGKTVVELLHVDFVAFTDVINQGLIEAFSCMKYTIRARTATDILEAVNLIRTSPNLLEFLEQTSLDLLKSQDTVYKYDKNNWKVLVAVNPEIIFQGYPLVDAWKFYLFNGVKDALVQVIGFLESTSSWYSFIDIFEKSELDYMKSLWNELFQKLSNDRWQNNEMNRRPESMEILHPPLALKFPFSQTLINQLLQVGEMFLLEEDIEDSLNEVDSRDRSIILDKYNPMIEHCYNEHVGIFECDEECIKRLEQDFYNICSFSPELNLKEELRVKLCKLYLQEKLGSCKQNKLLSKLTVLTLTWALQKTTISSLLHLASVCGSSVQEHVLSTLQSSILADPREDSEDSKEIEHDVAERIVKFLCEQLLPTETHMSEIGGSIIWFQKTTQLLAFASKVSFSSPVLHYLRLCIDIYFILPQLPFKDVEKLASFHESSFAKAEKEDELEICDEGLIHIPELFDLDSFDCYNLIHGLISGYNVSHDQAQKLICMYYARCMDANCDSPRLPDIFQDLRNKNLPDTDLTYAGPVLHRILLGTAISDYISQFLKEKIVAEEDNVIDQLLSGLKRSDRHPLVGLLLDIIEGMVRAEIETYEDKIGLLEKASSLVDAENNYSLQYIVAVAFVRVYLQWFSSFLSSNNLVILTEKKSFVQRIDHLLSSIRKNRIVPSEKLLYLLKCLNTSSLKELRIILMCIPEAMPIVKTIIWPVVDIIQGPGMNGLALHAYYPDAKKKLQSLALNELIANIQSDPSILQGAIAALAETFYWVGYSRSFSDRENVLLNKDTIAVINKLRNPLPQLIKGVLAVEEFLHKSLNISTKWKYIDCAQASFLLHISTALCDSLSKSEHQPFLLQLMNRFNTDNLLTMSTEKVMIFVTECVHGHTLLHVDADIGECFVCRNKNLKHTEKAVNIEHRSSLLKAVIDLIQQACVIAGIAIGKIEDNVEESERNANGLSVDDCNSHSLFINLWNIVKEQLNISNRQLISILHLIIDKCKNCLNKTVFVTQIQETLIDYRKKGQEFRMNVAKVMGTTSNLYDLLEETDNDESHSESYCMFLSRRRMIPTVEDLKCHMRTVTQCSSQFAFLRLVIDEEESLQLLKCLSPILTWHLLIHRYVNHKINHAEARKSTLYEYIFDEPSLKDYRKEAFGNFERSWKTLRESDSISKKLNIELPEIYLGSPVCHCVVQQKDNPIFSVLQLLSNLQNIFIEKSAVVALDGNMALNFICKDTGVMVPHVLLHTSQPSNIVKFELTENFLRHCQNSVKYGYGEWIQYDLERIEREIADKMLVGKCYLILDEQFPLTVYQNQLFHWCSHILLDVNKEIKQVLLPDQIGQRLKQSAGEQHGQQSFRALLNYLEVVIALLRKTKGSTHEKIGSYASRWGISSETIQSQTILHLLQNEIMLSHLVATYELVEEKIAHVSVESLGCDFSHPIDSVEKQVNEFVTTYDIAAPFITAVRRFTVRFLSNENKKIAPHRFKDLMCHPSMWSGVVSSDGRLSDGKRLVDVFPSALLAEHTRKLHDYLHDIVKSSDKQKSREKRPPCVSSKRGKAKKMVFSST